MGMAISGKQVKSIRFSGSQSPGEVRLKLWRKKKEVDG